MVRTMLVVGLWVAGLVACSGSSSPKMACDTLASCNLSSSGFSCDTASSSCASCINSSSCSDLTAGSCATACPGATFKPK
ncbi:MAG TPA: hypothetical protein VLM85_03970 [Polyangiaceae bacterium]|nr:hypothetical protein [Polyangiaceae bacterium]